MTDRGTAMREELRIKRLSRTQKLALLEQAGTQEPLPATAG
jgi:predicted GIY-YIG superfamily endonuclease